MSEINIIGRTEKEELDSGLIKIKTYFKDIEKIFEIYFEDSDGNKTGLYKRYSSKGKVILKINYTNGIYNGLYESFNSKGLPLISKEYLNGILNGSYTSYWQNTKIVCEESEWEEGLINGEYKIYNEEGKLKYHRIYEKGILKEKIK